MSVGFVLVLCLAGLAIELGSIILLGRSATRPWEQGPAVPGDPQQSDGAARPPVSCAMLR